MPSNSTNPVTVVLEPLLQIKNHIKRQLDKLNSLQQRILTALIFIPVGLGAIWIGSPYFDMLIVLIMILMAREWSRMVMGIPYSPLAYCFVVLILGLLYFDLSTSHYIKWAAVALVGSFFLHLYQHQKQPSLRFRDFIIYGLGSLYITWSLFILVYMVNEGLQLFFMWMLLIVLSSDIGAYFAGRFIGGPKLAPSISPNKTWAGFTGGLALACLVGFFTAPYLQTIYIIPSHIIGACLFLSMMSHIGDLLESMVKRYYHVKDSGTILPGHGGVLDRFDSMLLVSFAAIVLLFSGL